MNVPIPSKIMSHVILPHFLLFWLSAITLYFPASNSLSFRKVKILSHSPTNHFCQKRNFDFSFDWWGCCSLLEDLKAWLFPLFCAEKLLSKLASTRPINPVPCHFQISTIRTLKNKYQGVHIYPHYQSHIKWLFIKVIYFRFVTSYLSLFLYREKKQMFLK